MGMGGDAREIFSGAEGAALWSSGFKTAKSLQPFRADDRLEPARNGGDTQPGGTGRGGTSGVLRFAVMQPSGAELLVFRGGVSGGGVGNQPLPLLPFREFIQPGDRPRTPEVADDYPEADGKACKVELTPAGV